MTYRICFAALFCSIWWTTDTVAQQNATGKQNPPFQWVNPLRTAGSTGIQHATFHSAANQTEVGYCILLPPDYDNEHQQEQRYPVIYWLHGGRPGSETKNVAMGRFFLTAMQTKKIPPLIYVFPNGGRMSHYDHGEYKGEQAFLELIQHIDANYRTIADRKGRAVEGFSQGGRGAGRYLLKYPQLFCSAAPLGGGHQHEKRISESDGKESNSFTVSPAWNNTWDLVTRDRHTVPQPRIFVAVGSEDFNFEANQEWSKHLTRHGIEHQFKIVPGIPHSSVKMYEKIGDEIMAFHIQSFRNNGALGN